MRISGLLVTVLLLWAADANAGLRATYRIADEETPLIVDVADNGDVSFGQPGGDTRVAVVGGHAFFIGDFDEGLKAVRLTDLTRALRTTGAPPLEMDEPLPTIPSALSNVTAAPAGARTVGGISGTVYHLTAGKGVTIEGGDEVVATGAPALQPIGQAIRIMLTEGEGVMILLDRIGPDVARVMRMLGRIAALGTPLEWKGLYGLRAVTTMRIPPETIALPGTPVTPEALIAKIRAMAPGA